MSNNYYSLDAQRFLRDSWRLNAGYTDTVVLKGVSNLEELKKTEWSLEFEQLMRRYGGGYEPFFTAMKNRLIMGSFRYGRLNAKGKAKFDRMERINIETQLFNSDNSLERLIDIANMCLLEYEEGEYNKYDLALIARRVMRIFSELIDQGLKLKSSDDALHTRERAGGV